MKRQTASEKLMAVQQMFYRFNGKPATKETRKDLSDTIKIAIKDFGFNRKDNEKVIDLKWHTEPSLSPEISIGLDNNGNIWVCDDSLWRQIEGLYEAEQERKAYARDF